ncbi:MAG: Rpn family recombination-promoting nuclease/putative transposase [Lachnospiraceae bacterium]|nr:Rpn family recombination-promoting nuclease/putative transposase [Lachnospiraceae bacterium]MEE1341266.1 Rpn family recombination-promoting nuclease/putative transposase [Lachnospiraceae bacterium]
MADNTQQNVTSTHFSNESFTGKLPYTLTNDFFFKVFLQRNETALRGLLCAMLSMKSEEITDIVVTNPIQEGDTVNDKNVILDIKVEVNKSQIINLEMQVENLGNWPERSLTYLCRMFDQLKSGEDYKNVKKTIHIGILDFTPKDFPHIFYSNYFLYNPQTGHKYSDKFGIYMLQLNQIGNLEDEKEMPELYYWASLFKATTWEEIQMLAEKNESIKKSIVTLKELTADEKAQMQMEARERYRRDMVAAQDFGREQSEEQIKELKDNLQQSQEEIVKLQEENIKKDERIRFLEEQLANTTKNS